MTWEQGLALASVAVTAFLGWLTYKRGSHADDVLDVAANVKTTFEAQAEFNVALREENKKIRLDLIACEEGHVEDRRAFAAAQAVIDDQAREIARLKATVDEHEMTIARHELTINQLRAGTQADRREN